jgi:hypothetical protein
VSSEAMSSSLAVYEYVKIAAKKMPGFKTIAQQLGKRFKAVRSKSSESTAPSPSLDRVAAESENFVDESLPLAVESENFVDESLPLAAESENLVNESLSLAAEDADIKQSKPRSPIGVQSLQGKCEHLTIATGIALCLLESAIS